MSLNFNQTTTQFYQDPNTQAAISQLTNGEKQLIDSTTAQSSLSSGLCASLAGFNIGDDIMAKPSGPGVNVRKSYSPTSSLIYPNGLLPGLHGKIAQTYTDTSCSTPSWYQINWDSDPHDSSTLAQQLPGWSYGGTIQLVPLGDIIQRPDLRSPEFQSSENQYSYSQTYTYSDGPYGPSSTNPSTWPIGGTDATGHYGDCTWYAYGRLLELGQSSQYLTNVTKNGDAAHWISNAKNADSSLGVFVHDVLNHEVTNNGKTTAEPSYTPQAGDIATWVTSKLAHVAIVESIDLAEGTYTVSESSYSLTPEWNFLWRARTIPLSANSPQWGFQYFIHLATQRASQSISPINFIPTTLTVGGTTTANTTSNSGLQITFSSTTPGVCSVTAEGNVTGISAGTCWIAANQAGDNYYNPAPQMAGSITVTTGTATPVISNFTADPTTINAGDSASLSWSIAGATSVSIDNGVGMVNATSGNITVTPSSTTTYTLSAANSAGTIIKSITVTVNSNNSSKPVIGGISPSSIPADNSIS